MKKYHQKCEHGLCNIEAMTPVVIGDLSIALADRVNKSHQHLWKQNCNDHRLSPFDVMNGGDLLNP